MDLNDGLILEDDQIAHIERVVLFMEGAYAFAMSNGKKKKTAEVIHAAEMLAIIGARMMTQKDIDKNNATKEQASSYESMTSCAVNRFLVKRMGVEKAQVHPEFTHAEMHPDWPISDEDLH